MAKFEFKINITTLLMIAFGVFVFLWFNDKKNDEIARWESNYEAKSNAFEEYRLRSQGTIATKSQAIALLNQELEEVVESDSVQRQLARKYKRLALANKTETVFVTDTVTVEVPIEIDTDTTITLEEACFKADFSLSNGLFTLNGIDIQNTQDIVAGLKRDGLFKREYGIDVHNSNQCIQTQGMTTYIVVEKKKWWENPIIVGLGSFTAGYITHIATSK